MNELQEKKLRKVDRVGSASLINFPLGVGKMAEEGRGLCYAVVAS